MRALLIAALAVGLALPASAQSLYGPGGLFLHPTASLPDAGQLTPAVLVLPQDIPGRDSMRTWVSASLDYGVTDDLEIGATWLKVTAWDRDPSYGGYFKYRLLRETDDRPALAFGMTQLGFGDVNSRIGFLAARKQLSRGRHGVVGHLGVLYTDEIDGVSHHRWEPYAGVEVGLARNLTFIAEGRPGSEGYLGTPLALTLAYRASENYRLALTWANAGHATHPSFGFGAGISLSSRR